MVEMQGYVKWFGEVVEVYGNLPSSLVYKSDNGLLAEAKKLIDNLGLAKTSSSSDST